MTKKELEIKVESLEKKMGELRHGAQHGGGEGAPMKLTFKESRVKSQG